MWEAISGYPTGMNVSNVTKMRSDQKALTKICLTLESSAITHVRNTTTAAEAWKVLENAHEDKGISSELSSYLRSCGIQHNLAVRTAVYLKNRYPHHALNNEIPYELWNGCKPDLGNLRDFRCRALIHIPFGTVRNWILKLMKLNEKCICRLYRRS